MNANLIDSSYDDQFSARRALRWWPWVGTGFSQTATRTMIVGESVYLWGPAAEERYRQVDGLRITHANHAMALRRDSRYVRNIERAVFAARRPSDRQKAALWSSVAYHNLVLRPLTSRSHRPSETDYADGWRELFDLCQLMGIQQCLVYGFEAGKLKALESAAAQCGHACTLRAAGQSGGRHATLQMGHAQLQLLFVRHPSAFFSWRQWAPVVRAHLALGFLPNGQAPGAG